MKEIQTQWESYKANVLPTDAHPIQLTECRRAFYAGAMTAVMQVILAIDDDRDSAVLICNRLREECMAFKAKVKRGGDPY